MIEDVSDPAVIAAWAARDPLLHLYEIGDLDPFFWPYTRWWGRRGEDGAVAAICLLYTGTALPALIALERDRPAAAAALLAELRPHLPRRFYAHLSPPLVACFGDGFRAEPHGRHLKMGLAHPERIAAVDTSAATALGPDDATALQELYARSYPGNWFDPRMLATGQYFGVRREGRLRAVAGVHVYSARHRVAALGNITTDPDWRGRGLARVATSALCASLLRTVTAVGLNVRADNAPALALYRGLGFEEVAPYDEVMIERSD